MSFYYDQDDSKKNSKSISGVGEIFICVERVKSQAKNYSNTFIQELYKLLIHGLTHIAGYDHKNNKDHIEMQKIENKIMQLWLKK